MSLQERTLVIKNFDPEKTTNKLLKELCLQGGPVRNVVVKPDHAFVEYEDIESVGYSKALLDGVELFGRKLEMEPKTRGPTYYKYTQILHDYIRYDRQRVQQQALQHQQEQLRLQQHQQMLAYYNSQPFPNPIPVETNEYVSINQLPHIVNPAEQYEYMNPAVLPSTSVPRHSDNVRRPAAFNQHHQRTDYHRSSSFGGRQDTVSDRFKRRK